MKIVATGGHLAPLLSVLEVLPKSTQVLVVGRKHTFEGDTNLSFEYRTAKELKIPFKSINTGRLQRVFTKYTVLSLLKIPLGFFQSFQIVKEFRPDIILSFGGYISLPVVLAGAIFRIPIVIHEQTLTFGLANKIASFFARKICISWETSRNFFPKEKTVLTGNPIRKYRVSNIKYYQASKEKLPLIYITGGSAGSHNINVLVEECLDKLLDHYLLIHQTGEAKEFGDFDRLQYKRRFLSKDKQERYFIAKFIEPHQVGTIIHQSDLVICRSGINTVTELIFHGKPALLIPLNKEQMANAVFLKKLGLGEILLKEKASGEMFFNLIQLMMANLSSYNQKKEGLGKLIKRDGAEKIVKILYDELETEKKKSAREF